MHPLFHYINTYALLTENEFEEIIHNFIHKKIKRKQYILQEGQICNHISFIAKGAMRKFYLDEDGNEHVVDLYVENWWADDRESFANATSSNYNIEAWEDCELYLLSRENKIKLCNECPPFNEFIIKLDERYHIATQKRITSSISYTAEKRYDDFINRHPYFVQRFPQHLIASYLGITKDTLSRIRRKALKK